MYNTNSYYYNGRQPYYMPANYQPIQQPEGVFVEIKKLSADQIKGYVPPLGSRLLLLDEANLMAYYVGSDTMGNMFKQPYNYSLVNSETAIDVKKEEPSFATKEDFEKLKKEIESLRSEYGRANNQSENQQPNI